MSILDEFDPVTQPLFTPEHIYGRREKQADICIVSFHHRVLAQVLARFSPEIAATAATANGPVDIYRFGFGGRKLLFYMSTIGAPAAGAILQEAKALTGTEKFIVFGSCGVLVPEKCTGRTIVPTESYRDEGLSYHFAPPSDYIAMKNSGAVAEFFAKRGIPFVSGRNWTTDAIYRETTANIARHRADGCLSVEMEAAGLQAVADAIGAELYVFFFGGDVLEERWSIGDLGGETETARQQGLFDLALGLAAEIPE